MNFAGSNIGQQAHAAGKRYGLWVTVSPTAIPLATSFPFTFMAGTDRRSTVTNAPRME
jgi:hypothetical protein